MARKQTSHRRIGIDGPRLGRRLPDLLPDPVDGADQLQDRARRLSRCRRIPVLRLDARELRRGAGALELLCARQLDRAVDRRQLVGLAIAVPAAWSMAFAPTVPSTGPDPRDVRGHARRLAATVLIAWLTSSAVHQLVGYALLAVIVGLPVVSWIMTRRTTDLLMWMLSTKMMPGGRRAGADLPHLTATYQSARQRWLRRRLRC